MEGQSYQSIPSSAPSGILYSDVKPLLGNLTGPSNPVVVASNIQHNGHQHVHGQKITHEVRQYWGPDMDVSIDIDSGHAATEIERHRIKDLVNMVNAEHFDPESYSEAFMNALRINNLVYKVTYQVFFIFLAFVVGIFTSFSVALMMAAAEFMNQFMVKPFLKMGRIFVSSASVPSKWLYEICRPVMALVLPWNKH